MSSSATSENSAIFVTDTPDVVRSKITKYAFSGGQETLALHRQMGGNPDIDVSYIYLTFFCPDDQKLKDLYTGFKEGRVLSRDMKAALVDVLVDLLRDFQTARDAVTMEQVHEYFKIRPLHGSS
uniref:tryptophan--tRNA ligase n=1 Tax=Lygus hesperus TaxID=30085 RepID=A0A146MCW6_LYGHE